MISRFQLVLAAALSLLAVGTIHADTVFVASDGLLVHMPRSTLKILDPPEVWITDDDGLPKKVKIEQLNIAGTLKGNMIGWHPDYGPNFFIVSVVDSKSGRISTLPQNIIKCTIKPSRTGKGFMGYFNNKTPANVTSYPDFLFQLRVLQLPHKEDAMHPHRSRFLVSTAYRGQYLFYLDEETDPGTGIKTLSATEVGEVKTDVPGGYGYRVINIDLIDPRQYQSNEIRKDDPYAIAMWIDDTFGKGEYWSHEKNVFKYLASNLLIATVDDSGDIPLLKIRRVSDDAGAFSRMTRNAWKQPTAITGGALINPDEHGVISYWFTKSVHYWSEESRQSGFVDFAKETWSGQLTYNSKEKTFGMNLFSRSNDYRWSCKARDKAGLGKYGNLFGKTTDFIPNMFAWNHNPRIRGEMRQGTKDIFIDSVVAKDKACLDKETDFIEASWESKSFSIGTINYADRDEVEKAEAAITPDETLSLTKDEKALVAKGTKVDLVVYSWPYFAVDPANLIGNNSVATPTFTSARVEQVVEWEKSSHGGGFDAKLGFGMKTAVVEFSVSAIGGYARKFEKEDHKTETNTKQLTEERSTESSIDHFGTEGFVIYSEIRPQMKVQGTFHPRFSEVIFLPGLNDEFKFPVTRFDMIAEVPSRLQRFNIKNPNEEWNSDPKVGLKPSPLSKGLIARDFGSAIACNGFDCERVKAKIAKWEQEAKLQGLITLSKLTKDYEEKRENGADTGVKDRPKVFYCDNKDTHSFSEQVMKTKITDSSWYAGFNFTMKPVLIGAVADVTAKYSGAYIYKSSVGDTESWAMTFPRAVKAGDASRLKGSVLSASLHESHARVR
ncbi:hypothetical protein [Lamprocystis purpurea]|uniref:hypothetical protein n=1 Tax=Lamprocystis purpurea TaxID=61598 RepID=UPI000366454B|nr:hypothetical protein [Lamprocystis purpurea]